MKIRFLLLIILSVLFFNCDLGYLLQDHYEADIEGFMVDNGIDSEGEIKYWIAWNIDYKKDNPEEFWKIDDWQTPQETFNKRHGDCGDFVLLEMYMLDIIGIKSNFILLKNRTNLLSWHAVIQVNSIYYSSEDGSIFDDFNTYFIFEVKTLDEALYVAEYSLFRNTY